MSQLLFSKGITFLFRFVVPTAFLLFISFERINAQTTISTTNFFTNDTTVNTVTFNFQNTNTYPVVIKSIDGIMADYGQNNVALWYKTSAINGNPGNIATANGWAMASAATISGISNTTDTITQPFFTNLNLVIPANTTYGIAVSATGTNGGMLRAAHGLPAFSTSAGGCNIISGNNSGYAGMSAPPAAPTFSPVAWLGKITVAQVINCTEPTAAATISGPTAICANAMFTLTSSSYPAGMSIAYQWQKYNPVTLIWENILNDTNSIYVNTFGIVASTQFRLKTSCTSSGTPVYSNVLTINIGSGLPGGVYTINNNAASTTTNFVSFRAAAAAMKCGISGPVIINVDPNSGPYTENVFFNNIPGTSAVNNIRINGNGRILQYFNVASSTPIGIFTMSGTRYMSLDSLTLRSLNTTLGVGILVRDTARYDSISHCFIDMRSIKVVSGSGGDFNLTGIYLSEDNVPAQGFTDVKSCYVGYNHILGSNGTGGPEYGILNSFNNAGFKKTTTDSGNVMVYNVIENCTDFGIYSNTDDGTLIAYNDIHCTNKISNNNGFIGILCWGRDNYNSNITGNTTTNIIGNRIHNPSNYSGIPFGGNKAFVGIYLAGNVYNPTTFNVVYNGRKILVANNVIYNVNSSFSIFVYGIWTKVQGNSYNANDVNNTLIYHNTIDIGQTSNVNGDIYGIYVQHSQSNPNSSLFIKNNMVTLPGNPVVNHLYGFNYNFGGINGVYVQRNNYYLNNNLTANQFYGKSGLVNYTNLINFQTAFPSMEVGSLSVNPQYYSPSTGDFTPLNYVLSGNGENLLTTVSKDILGRNRSATPTPGAFEIVSDAGVNALLSPSGSYCSSTKMVQVNVHNFSIVNISNVQLNWRLNGVLQTPVSYTGTIAPNGNAAVNLGNVLFPMNTPVTIKAWTSIPNGQTDGLNTNDTLTVTTQSTISLLVNIGPDDSVCAGNTLTLDAGNPGSTYLWDNLTTAQTRTIQNAGTYYVKVTTSDGCLGVDTMNLSLLPLPAVNLGPDAEICEGDSLTFDASNSGAGYMWDNGAITQTRVVDTAGNYAVQVTNDYGCIGADTVIVTMKPMPMADAINATYADSGLYTFYPLNPEYVTNYIWNFGDNSPEAGGLMVQHQYQHNGIYTVMLKMEGECPGSVVTQTRAVDVFSAPGGGTGVGGILIAGDILLYPNPAKDIMQIENKSDGRMLNVAVYNILGQLIINQRTDHTKQYELNTSTLANGSYSIRIETDKGMFVQKFEVMK